ncbi:serine--tRNA ligase, mitochondrial [Bombyx mandarina]|uniref:serine--tRNA ligase n=1 Tax=Bombyx mandarina TaxID=7092 RepID=A0A6J2JEV3_BOMMA|nr:serine--tRNA ligase, mitochondrial [Bombyx mandarina]
MLYISSLIQNYRIVYSTKGFKRFFSQIYPNYNLQYYCNPKNHEEIKQNIKIRKGVGDVDRVMQLYKIITKTSEDNHEYERIKQDLYEALSILPNKTHPFVKGKFEPHIAHEINKKKDFGEYKPFEFSEITRLLNLMRIEKLGHTCGHKSYYFFGELAELEEALIKYTVKKLLDDGFQLISVPDILASNVLESCGMSVKSDRTQIYSLDPHHHGTDLCLSGTAEMSLAGLLANSVHNINDLPLKLAAVSRCYRAETSNLAEERGIYRVHQFNKVEMFVVTTSEQSEEMLEVIRNTQEQIFTPLGISVRVLDMPPYELGAAAYRKYDMEAWMPGRQAYGEISSCSNCTDYQSRRLNITYKTLNDEYCYVHTLNGTACAIPRMLIALIETHQHPKGKIIIPETIQKFMNGKKFIMKNTKVPELKLLKIKR